MPRSSVDSVVSGNIQMALQASGKSAYAVATALGYAPNWLYRVVKGEAGMLLPTLREVATELGVSAAWLVDAHAPGEGSQPQIASWNASSATVDSVTGPPRVVGTDIKNVVDVPEFDTPPSPDVPRSDTGIVRWEQVPNDELEALGADPAHCEMVRVRSTLTNLNPPEGCVILVDRSQTKPQQGRAYLLDTREGLAVKWVVWDEGFDGWAFFTDGPEWTRQPWPLWPDMVILGEALFGFGFYRSP